MCLLEIICVPVTLPSLLHCLATAEKAGCRPKKANGRNTLSCQGPSSPSSEARDPPRPGWPLPRNSVHILFWSVGDLFTQRSRFLLPTNFMLQK